MVGRPAPGRLRVAAQQPGRADQPAATPHQINDVPRLTEIERHAIQTTSNRLPVQGSTRFTAPRDRLRAEAAVLNANCCCAVFSSFLICFTGNADTKSSSTQEGRHPACFFIRLFKIISNRKTQLRAKLTS